MIRVRRYRVFLFVTLFILFGLYYLSDSTSWSTAAPLGPASHLYFGSGTVATSPEELKENVDDDTPKQIPLPPGNTEETKDLNDPHAIPLPPVKTDIADAQSKTSTNRVPVVEQDSRPAPVPGDLPSGDYGQLDEAVPTPPPSHSSVPENASEPVIHWKTPTQRYPIPTQSLIPLPRGKPKKLRSIQYDFPAQSPAANQDRERKLTEIKAVFKRFWDGYKKFAWGHDELKPVSGGYRDPFAGWGATLVDSLDTLWIMDMKKEFEEAVNATSKIDFTTCDRYDIPVFEVTIRYLGGLLGAYDVSGRKYKVLLDKAQELGEILIGAFDTPNRMPVMYYHWQPQLMAMEQEAGSYTVLAELGSLSLEFTRLAQLTKQAKYYDAVARVTDALYDWQANTKLPGLYPLHVDASGCSSRDNRPSTSHSQVGGPAGGSKTTVLDKVEDLPEAKKPASGGPTTPNGDAIPNDKASAADRHAEDVEIMYPKIPSNTGVKRGLSPEVDVNGIIDKQKRQKSSDINLNCNKANLSSGGYGTDQFTFGGMADSTYEYFPKTYLLLGGLEEKYKYMHEYAIDSMKQYLLYRPMVKGNWDIRFTGTYSTDGEKDRRGNAAGSMDSSTGHLTCFVGALVGLGAKLFNRGEIDLAARLTDGCVWAYNETASGVMPEDIEPIVCQELDRCDWDESRWWRYLDPDADNRVKSNSTSKATTDAAPSAALPKPASGSSRTPAKGDTRRPAATPTTTASSPSSEETEPVTNAKYEALNKRQLKDASGEINRPATETTNDVWPPSIAADEHEMRPSDSPSPISFNSKPASAPNKSKQSDSQPGPGIASSSTSSSSQYSPGRQSSPELVETPYLPDIPENELSHEEFVKQKIKKERLTPGLRRIGGRNYILRPEAIESVFYMYRITGQNRWREKGWTMFNAVNNATRAANGNSAVIDVTVSPTRLSDSAESFWTAETLKYFYLLFSSPDLISLDDYVLNTEAHPFSRPKV